MKWKRKKSKVKSNICVYAKVLRVEGRRIELFGPNIFWSPSFAYCTKHITLIEGLWHRFELTRKKEHYYITSVSSSVSKDFLYKYLQSELI